MLFIFTFILFHNLISQTKAKKKNTNFVVCAERFKTHPASQVTTPILLTKLNMHFIWQQII